VTKTELDHVFPHMKGKPALWTCTEMGWDRC
jgi:hypothetical protein